MSNIGVGRGFKLAPIKSVYQSRSGPLLEKCVDDPPAGPLGNCVTQLAFAKTLVVHR